jgi:hypothetical protein
MAFTDQESAISAKVLWAMTSGIVIILLGVAMIKTEFLDWALDQMRTPSQVETELMGRPEMAPFLKAVKAHYPDQHTKMINDYSNAVRKGRLPEDEDNNLINEYYSFMGNKKVLAPNASEATLLEIGQLRHDIADELHKGDRALCNSVYSGRAEPFTVENKKISGGYAQIEYLKFKAAREAEANAVPRDVDQNRQDDSNAMLEKAFALGLKEETETVGNMVYRRPSADDCDYMYYTYKAIQALPKAQQVRITARMIAG